MHGGKRPGAGRPKGAKGKKQAILLAAAAVGETPVDFLLRVMRDEGVDAMVRLDCAKAVAPYLHPRLAASVIKAEVEESQVVIFRTEYLAADGTRTISASPGGLNDAERRLADEAELARLKAARADAMKTIEHEG